MKRALLEKGEPTTWQEFLDAGMRALVDAFIQGGSAKLRSTLHGQLNYFANWHPRAMECWKRESKKARHVP